MAKSILTWIAGVAAVALMVGALWAWRFAPELAARNAADPYNARLGIRSLALALGALAQALVIAFVIGRVYPFRLPDKLLCGACALVGVASLGVAIELGWS